MKSAGDYPFTIATSPCKIDLVDGLKFRLQVLREVVGQLGVLGEVLQTSQQRRFPLLQNLTPNKVHGRKLAAGLW